MPGPQFKTAHLSTGLVAVALVFRVTKKVVTKLVCAQRWDKGLESMPHRNS